MTTLAVLRIKLNTGNYWIYDRQGVYTTEAKIVDVPDATGVTTMQDLESQLLTGYPYVKIEMDTGRTYYLATNNIQEVEVLRWETA